MVARFFVDNIYTYIYTRFMKTPSEVSTQILINRVMSGKKEYRTTEYLQAFANISSNELHTNTGSKHELYKLWNSLQSTPGKVRYFTFSLVRDNDVVIKKIKEFYSHEKYAYICHDKDKISEHKHYHYVLMFESPRSFKTIANDLEIPVTMLQKVYSKKGILDYLTHENDPNKYHYSLDEIHANFDIEEEKKKDDGPNIDEEFSDFCKLRNGEMPLADWWEKWKNIFYDAISVGATPRRLLSQLRNPAAARPVYGFLFFTKFPSNPAKNLLII